MVKKLDGKRIILLGVTLFSMFFGAGNLIFPPYLGYLAGQEAVPAFIGFMLTAVVFPVLGVTAVARTGGLDHLCEKVHPAFALVFSFAVYLCLNPGIAAVLVILFLLAYAVLRFKLLPKEQKDMIKGAAVGSLIAGDGGAVVGAMAAKEKHKQNKA